jgi:iron complex outermembrane receptor protein
MLIPFAFLVAAVPQQAGTRDTVAVRLDRMEIRAAVDSAAGRAVQPVSLLGGAALRTAQGASIGETLAGIPGLRSMSMSTGIGKPVIRGLHSNRIVTLDAGQRVETQQWGADHAPNIETMGAERIEVIKGPGSVRYGSDALGGVIHVVRRPLLDARDHDGWIGRRGLSLSYTAPLAAPDATLLMEGARGAGAVRATVTGRRSSDMRAASGRLDNTGNRATNVELTGAWRHAAAITQLTVAQRAERIEIYDDPATMPGFTGYQRISTDRVRLEHELPLLGGTLDATVGWERNFRREFVADTARDIQLGLLASTSTATLDWNHQLRQGWRGTLGAFASAGDFDKRGLQTLVPSSSTRDIALYLTEATTRGPLALEFGARVDRRVLRVANDDVLALAEQSRRFTAVTGSVGASYQLTTPLTLAVNVGRGFRAPSSSDLFANGFHEGTRAYERGDPTVDVERSLSTDVALRWRSDAVRAEVSAYENRIGDYIYLRPFGSGGFLFDSLEVVQGDAVLTGAEGNVTWRARPWLELLASGDYVRGTNTSTDRPLNYIPPPRGSVGARVQLPSSATWVRPHVQVQWEQTAQQTRTDGRDVAPLGYGLLQVRTGAALSAAGRIVLVDLSVHNALDRRYRDHMSRYKEFADAPGRVVVLKLTSEW